MNPLAQYLLWLFSQQPVPWIQALSQGQQMPAFVGFAPQAGLPIPLPGAGQWYAMNPLERQSYFQLAQMVGVPGDVMAQYLGRSFPEWGRMGSPLAMRQGF